ncbi:Amino acid-binding ACT [Mucinivorans hirudinis]|uniref:Amino acid-binding ACT n=1 Tax=Mucinivorans hirudinis TaxID=1433126 RepID=A0A060REI1_9BACT|nr:Amino acid-binding ACT [Mucinivorans hirudinis]
MTIKQLSVFIENRTGRVNEIARLLGANGVNMNAFCLAEAADFGILRMVVSDVELATEVLRSANFAVRQTDVVGFNCTNSPGSLAQVLDCLAQEMVFIEYMYAFSQGDTASVVIRPTNVTQCVAILERCNCELISSNNLYNI